MGSKINDKFYGGRVKGNHRIIKGTKGWNNLITELRHLICAFVCVYKLLFISYQTEDFIVDMKCKWKIKVFNGT